MLPNSVATLLFFCTSAAHYEIDAKEFEHWMHLVATTWMLPRDNAFRRKRLVSMKKRGMDEMM
jgi:hypothetical protein